MLERFTQIRLLPFAGSHEDGGEETLPLYVKAPVWVVLLAASWVGVYFALSLIF